MGETLIGSPRRGGISAPNRYDTVPAFLAGAFFCPNRPGTAQPGICTAGFQGISRVRRIIPAERIKSVRETIMTALAGNRREDVKKRAAGPHMKAVLYGRRPIVRAARPASP
jgi:hypothetical protein